MATFNYQTIHVFSADGVPTNPGQPGATYTTGDLVLVEENTDFVDDGDADAFFEIGDVSILDFETGTPPTIIPIPVTLIGSSDDFGGAPALFGYVPLDDLPPTFTVGGTTLPTNLIFGDGAYLVASPLATADFPGPFTETGRLSDFSDPTVMDTTTTSIPECYLAGTHISTPKGLIAVEDLKTGDEVYTADGDKTAVKWIGRQKVSTVFGTSADRVPVCIHAGTFGNGLPKRDLRVTADHALLIDNVLINAGALVNGETITWVPLKSLGDSYTVYHIETENHALILAEGTPAETYVDYAARQLFDNYDEYLALYGEDRAVREMPYPRISAPRLVPASVKARLSKTSVA